MGGFQRPGCGKLRRRQDTQSMVVVARLSVPRKDHLTPMVALPVIRTSSGECSFHDSLQSKGGKLVSMMASPRQLRKPACRVKVSALTLKALLRCVN